MQEVDRLAAEVVELVKDIENGALTKPAWIAVQDRVKAMKASDLTQQEIADKIDQSQQWVSSVLRWDTRGLVSPFAGQDHRTRPTTVEAGTRAAAKALEEKPEELAPQIAEALEKPEVIRAVQEAQAKREDTRKRDIIKTVAKSEGMTEEDVEAEIQATEVEAAQDKHEVRQRQAWLRFETEIGRARHSMSNTLRLARELDLDEEELELVIGGLDAVRDAAAAIINCLQGGESVDWDAAFAKYQER